MNNVQERFKNMMNNVQESNNNKEIKIINWKTKSKTRKGRSSDTTWYDPRWTRTGVVDRFLVGSHERIETPSETRLGCSKGRHNGCGIAVDKSGIVERHKRLRDVAVW